MTDQNRLEQKQQQTEQFWKAGDSQSKSAFFNEQDFDFTSNNQPKVFAVSKRSSTGVQEYGSTPIKDIDDIFTTTSTKKNNDLIDFDDGNISARNAETNNNTVNKQFDFGTKFDTVENAFNNNFFNNNVNINANNQSTNQQIERNSSNSIQNTTTNEFKEKLMKSNLVDINNLLDNSKMNVEIKQKTGQSNLNFQGKFSIGNK